MFPTQFVHGLCVGTDVPLQLFNTLLMLRPKQQREAKRSEVVEKGRRGRTDNEENPQYSLFSTPNENKQRQC